LDKKVTGANAKIKTLIRMAFRTIYFIVFY